MKRLLAALFLFASCLFAHAQDALVVAGCGLAPPPYLSIGDVLPITVDTNGRLCFSGAAGSVNGTGVAGQVTFWNATSSITGDPSFTFTAPGQLTLALGSINTNLKALNITGTFNNNALAFDAPLFMSITNTASLLSKLVDLQVGGTTRFSVDTNGGIVSTFFFYSTSEMQIGVGAANTGFNNISAANNIVVVLAGTADAQFVSQGVILNQSGFYGWSNQQVDAAAQDTFLARQGAAGVVGLHNNTLTSAAAFQVYNTSDVATGPVTNYERIVTDFTTTANVGTIATQAGGTGLKRPIQISPANGHTSFIGGSAPTANSCAGFALGTGSSDGQGSVTYTSATTCSITFGTAYTNAPICTITPGSAASTALVTTTTAGLAATFGTAQTAFFYHCTGT